MNLYRIIKIIGLVWLIIFFSISSFVGASSTFTFPEANIEITWDSVYSWWFTLISAYQWWEIPPRYQEYIKWEVYENWSKIYESYWESLLFHPENIWEHIIILYNNNIEVSSKIILVEQWQPSAVEDYNYKEIFLYGSIEQAIDITWIETSLLSNDWIYIRDNSWSWKINIWEDLNADIYVKYWNDFNHINLDISFPDNLEFIGANTSWSFINLWNQAWVENTWSSLISISWNVEENDWSFPRDSEKLISLNFKAKKSWTWLLIVWSNFIDEIVNIQSWGFYTQELSLASSYVDYNVRLQELNFIENTLYNKSLNVMLEHINTLDAEDKIVLLTHLFSASNINWASKLKAISQVLLKEEITNDLKPQAYNLLFNVIELSDFDSWDVSVSDAQFILEILSHIKELWIDNISSEKLYPFSSIVNNTFLSDLSLMHKGVSEISTIVWDFLSWNALLVPTWVVSKDITIEASSQNDWELIPKLFIAFWTQIKKNNWLSLVTWENAIIEPLREHLVPSYISKLDEVSMWKFNIWKTYSFAWSNTQNIIFWSDDIKLLLPRWDLTNSDIYYLKLKYFDYQNSQWIEETWVEFEFDTQYPGYLIVKNLTHGSEIVIWKNNFVPSAMFVTNILSWQSPLEVWFNWWFSSDQDWYIESFYWDFWDWNVWSWENVTHTYYGAWSYNAILTVKDEYWIDNSKSVLINVTNASPVSNFTMNNTAWEVPFNAVFDASTSTDSDWDIVLYEWDLWDGTVAIWKIVSHQYTSVWEYTVKLNVTDNHWLEWLSASTVSVLNRKPVAKFDMNIKEWNAPLTVTFNWTKSSDSDWSISSYHWDFWDWTSWNNSRISHIFTETWDFEVKLTVRDNSWLSWSVVKNVSVIPTRKDNVLPKAIFTQSVKSWKSPLSVSFDASKSTDLDWDIARFKWYFRDWSIWYWSKITHKYTDLWEFEVRLEVRDDIWWVWSASWLVTVTNTKPVAAFDYKADSVNKKLYKFDASRSKDEEWKIKSYNWDYWDWVFSKWVSVKHVYKTSWKFKVKLTVEDETGQKSELTKEIWIENIKPVASLIANKISGPAPLKVDFDAWKSIDSDWNIILYKWDFWDKDVWKWVKISHTFIKSWDYDVSLIVTDNVWATTEKKIQISVWNQKPFVNIVSNKKEWSVPLTISFDGSSSSDKDWKIVSYDWDFGDWEKWKWAKLSHQYKAWWEFTAKLTVVDNYWAVSSKTIKIKAITLEPVANFVFNPSTWASPLNVKFDASSSKSPWWKIISYDWDYWDLHSWTWKIASHEFKEDWTYLITLKIKNEEEMLSKIVKNLVIKNNKPVSLFSISSDSTDSLSINFDGKISKDEDGSVVSHDWDFGDWTKATSDTRNYRYEKQWSYIVTLNVKDDNGALSTIANELVLKTWEKPVVKELDSSVANMDWDKDWKINLTDFFLFVRKYSDKKLNKTIDLNNDNKKNNTDFSIFMYLYNKDKDLIIK